MPKSWLQTRSPPPGDFTVNSSYIQSMLNWAVHYFVEPDSAKQQRVQNSDAHLQEESTAFTRAWWRAVVAVEVNRDYSRDYPHESSVDVWWTLACFIIKKENNGMTGSSLILDIKNAEVSTILKSSIMARYHCLCLLRVLGHGLAVILRQCCFSERIGSKSKPSYFSLNRYVHK